MTRGEDVVPALILRSHPSFDRLRMRGGVSKDAGMTPGGEDERGEMGCVKHPFALGQVCGPSRLAALAPQGEDCGGDFLISWEWLF